MRAATRPRVLVVGGGFAGIAAAQAQRLDRRGTVERARHRFHRERVERIDPHRRHVHLADDTVLEYDAPILAAGAESATYGVPGVHEHALIFRDVEQCARIGQRLHELASSGHEARIVIVGGGLEGIEALDETLRHLAYTDVFVAGDAAGFPAGLAKQAYHALDMGSHAAANVERQLRDAALEAFRPSQKPMLVSFGDLTTFLAAGKLVIAGPALAVAKEAVFQLVMAQLDGTSRMDALARLAGRLFGTAQELLWPVVNSPRALLGQASFQVLTVHLAPPRAAGIVSMVTDPLAAAPEGPASAVHVHRDRFGQCLARAPATAA